MFPSQVGATFDSFLTIFKRSPNTVSGPNLQRARGGGARRGTGPGRASSGLATPSPPSTSRTWEEALLSQIPPRFAGKVFNVFPEFGMKNVPSN